MLRKTLLTLSLFLVTANCSSIGCVTEIGDDCTSIAECPSVVGSVCDVTAPDGYCTIVDCEPNECPAGSVCIDFDDDTAFCMAYCETDDDCRSGYKCLQSEEELGYCYVD